MAAAQRGRVGRPADDVHRPAADQSGENAVNVAVCPEHINILSICTGGAGLDLGFELAVQGARTVCMVEREAFAVAQLVSAMEAGLLAPAPIWSDARSFDGRAWRGAVDGLIGGIPCQPHSLAGKRLGEEDERDLWSDARRIIVQSGAWFVLIENVRGMLSSGGAERVWRDLHRLGFQTEGGLFTAAEVGASHERERFFILAVADRVGGGRNQGRRPDSQRHRLAQLHAADGGGYLSGVDLGDTDRQRQRGEGYRSVEARTLPAARGCALVNAESIGRGEGRAEPEFRSGRGPSAGASPAMGNTQGIIGEDIIDRDGPTRQHVIALDRATGRNGDGGSASRNLSRERGDTAAPWLRPVFPPGPADRDGWRAVLERAPELEPAFRRMADGLASRLDIARVDRLRMLGNGVVPLQAAYAIRTLATRLAARGSAGAARLVRLMEVAA
ncbi:DNA cytosine methyltransferase [Sinorhizobium glycinis]|uniref:DNA cytosine methyltransferase n=1 Tax=Sinorhizobium glycinis TaxID=1472378 RepID=UPI0009ED080E